MKSQIRTPLQYKSLIQKKKNHFQSLQLSPVLKDNPDSNWHSIQLFLNNQAAIIHQLEMKLSTSPLISELWMKDEWGLN